MFKGLGDIASMMKQAQEMQGRMSEMQDSLGQIRVEGSAGGGMVTVEATGQQKILNVHIEKSVFEAGDQEMLEDLIVAATNQALDKVKEAASAEMQKVTGNIDMSVLNDALSHLGLDGNQPTT